MLAVHLLRQGAPHVALIDRRPEPALGLAYGAAHPSHLLNVRAANMSAFPDAPADFASWLAARGLEDAGAAFAPRTVYGAYLQHVLAAAQREHGERLELINDSAVDLDLRQDGATISLESGASIDADAAALATGNLPPLPPRGVDPGRLAPGRFFGDPWVSGVADGLGEDDLVLIIGTGLTMVDMVLLLGERGYRGRIIAISRRGLLPHGHAAGAPAANPRTAPAAAAASLVRDVRARAAAIGWRQAVDELRPYTQALWRDAAPAERGRILRHLRPWWDVHRHRIAPQVHARLEAMIDSGQLMVAAGKLLGAEDRPAGVAVSWRPRGSDSPRTLVATRIVNCTGPEGDLPRTRDPLLRRLLERGTIRPGNLGIGLDVAEDMRVIGADGSPHHRMFALGPPTRGALWEIVAVPDIRSQAADVARRLVEI
jgi:uncharacterized NAD(P)/FAD-binding protein YdhS